MLPSGRSATALDAPGTLLPTHRSLALSKPSVDLGAPPAALTRLQLAALTQRRQELAQRGAGLAREWKQRFPKGSLSFTLTRLGGESNTLLRWRCSGGACRPRAGRLELAQLREGLAALPAPVRVRVLQFEQARIELNYEYALVAYQLARLEDLDKHRVVLAGLRRPANPATTRRN